MCPLSILFPGTAYCALWLAFGAMGLHGTGRTAASALAGACGVAACAALTAVLWRFTSPRRIGAELETMSGWATCAWVNALVTTVLAAQAAMLLWHRPYLARFENCVMGALAALQCGAVGTLSVAFYLGTYDTRPFITAAALLVTSMWLGILKTTYDTLLLVFDRC
eukprot:gene26209-18462_t